MMNFYKKRLLEQIIGGYLFPQGFSLRGDEKRQFWVFYTRKNEVTRNIEIIESGWNRLMLRYYTTLTGWPMQITYFMREKGIHAEEWGYLDSHRGWYFSNKEDYKNVLMIFRRLIECYVLDELERLSVFESKVRIREENYQYLKTNIQEILAEKKAQWDLKNQTLLWQCGFLSEKISLLRDREFEEAEAELSAIGLAYGEMILQNFGGEWKWNDELICLLVRDIAGAGIRTFPLNVVLDEWQGKGTMRDDVERIRKEIGKKTGNETS